MKTADSPRLIWLRYVISLGLSVLVASFLLVASGCVKEEPPPSLEPPREHQGDFIKQASSLPTKTPFDEKTIEVAKCQLSGCEPIIDPGPILEIRVRGRYPEPPLPKPKPDSPDSIEIVIKNLSPGPIEEAPRLVYIQTSKGEVYMLEIPELDPHQIMVDNIPAKGIESLSFYLYTPFKWRWLVPFLV